MTRLAPLWQQNGSYPANTDRVLINTLWPTAGVTGGATALVSNTMNVTVAAGTAAVPLTSGNYSALCRWDAAETVTLTAAPPAGNSRIDLIVLQVRDAVLDAGSNNDFLFQAVAGTPTTGTPVAPAVPNNALAVAQITVPGGAANLNGATLTDRRTQLATAGPTAHPYKARIWRNAALSGAITAATIMPFDTITPGDDPNGNMATGAAAGYTCPVAGWYQVFSRLSITSGGALPRFFTSVYKNGAEVARGIDTQPPGAWAASQVAALIPCAARDLIQLYYYLGASGTSFEVGVQFAYLNVNLHSM